MAVLNIAVAVLLSVVAVPFLLPFLGALLYRRSHRLRTQLLAKAQADPAQKRNGSGKNGSAEDEEWEKVDISTLGSSSKSPDDNSKWSGIIGFFHPFCNAGGGGERVLWAAIRATQLRWPQAVCVVYTGDQEVDKNRIVKRVKDRFNIELNSQTIHFAYLSTRHYVLASTWPRFTLLGQSLGSLILALDAFLLLTPDIFVDTMGYAFALYLSKLLFPRIPTAAYVHYPTISTDMLGSLDKSQGSEQGLHAGAGKGWKGSAKRRYWQLFAAVYSRVGASVDVVMTNSSWTQAHIKYLWGEKRKNAVGKSDIAVVFPPVAVEEVEESIEVSKELEHKRQPHLLYIAQFRPEKNHTLILQAFAQLIAAQGKTNATDLPRLVLVGSVRDNSDATRVYRLRLLAHELQIKDQVDFVCDASWPQVLSHLGSSSIGVNGMWNEHFGIGVVEYQAAGLISVVNDSGGPKQDIVVDVDGDPTGFHASTSEQYASAFEKALSLSADETIAMRTRARKNARRFTEEAFASKWVDNMKELIVIQRRLAT